MTSRKVLVLGCGRVGRTIARDLSSDFSVTVADSNQASLDKLKEEWKYHAFVTTKLLDASDEKLLHGEVQPYDLVIGAVPGSLGYQVLETVIQAGKNVVDISFFPEDPRPLRSLAKAKGVIAAMDCGIAPGASNMIVSHFDRLGPLLSAEIFVGGLPQERSWPFEYAAGFSPADVIEEYTRPARYLEAGQVITKPALTDPEQLYFEGIGTLEAVNTDGLRTMLYSNTLKCRTLKEKTMRYPGHFELMRVFRETGLFDQHAIWVDGSRVRPLDVTSKLLFPKWELGDKRDFTAMRIVLIREADGVRFQTNIDMLDRAVEHQGVLESSMARTTGYTCTAVARAVFNGLIEEPGFYPPEALGASNRVYEHVMACLKESGISFSFEDFDTAVG